VEKNKWAHTSSFPGVSLYVAKFDHSIELHREERREPGSSASELLVSEKSVLSVPVLRTLVGSAIVNSLANGDGGLGLGPLRFTDFNALCLEAFGACRRGALEDIAQLVDFKLLTDARKKCSDEGLLT
jgi:hypothetical protein